MATAKRNSFQILSPSQNEKLYLFVNISPIGKVHPFGNINILNVILYVSVRGKTLVGLLHNIN